MGSTADGRENKGMDLAAPGGGRTDPPLGVDRADHLRHQVHWTKKPHCPAFHGEPKAGSLLHMAPRPKLPPVQVLQRLQRRLENAWRLCSEQSWTAPVPWAMG